MFTSKGCNIKIDKIQQEILLRLIRIDYESSLYDMVSTLNERNNRQHCINFLLTEVYKYLNSLSPELMNKAFNLLQNHYKLRNLILSIYVKFYCLLSKKIWQTLPSEVKDYPSL